MVSGLWVFRTVPKAHDFWTVLETWDSPRTMGQSQKPGLSGAFGTDPGLSTGFISQFQKFKMPGTVPGLWDCPKDPESHMFKN